jgi:hypothetical protein
MNKTYLPVLAFSALLLTIMPFSFEFATSVVPGWHTTIYPPQFVFAVAVLLVLIFCTIGYWLSANRVDKTNWVLFVLHLTLTIPAVILVRCPWLVLDLQQANRNELLQQLPFIMKLLLWLRWLLLTGQVLFVVYMVRAIRMRMQKKSIRDIKSKQT